MLDPFSLLPLALAGHGGRVDQFEAQQLVASGLALLQRCAPLVRALTRKRSAVLLPTCPQFLVALAASEGRGAVVLDPLASRFEIAQQLAEAEVGAVFTNSALAPLLPVDMPHVLLDDAPRQATAIVSGTPRGVDLGSHVGLSLEGDPAAAGSRDEAVVVYTSAMAGRRLGVKLSHRNLLANAKATATVVGSSADDRVLALLPFSHLLGFTATMGAPLLSGAAVATMPDFDAAKAAELLRSGTITEVVGTPSTFRAITSALERTGGVRGGEVRALRACVCAVGPLPMSLQDRWFDLTGVELREGYGLTEAGSLCLFNRVDRANIRGTVGTPLPGVEVIVDAGEILVRGDNVFLGYVARGDAGLPVRDGWLRTGDGGEQLADGSIRFTGHIKPMLTRGGFEIYPREIERAVAQHPAVDRARLVVDAAGGADEPRIVLEVQGRVGEPELRAWCDDRLARYEQPDVIRFV